MENGKNILITILAGIFLFLLVGVAPAVHAAEVQYPDYLDDDNAKLVYSQERSGVHLTHGVTITIRDELSGELVEHMITDSESAYYHSRDWSDYKAYLDHPDYQMPEFLQKEPGLSYVLLEMDCDGNLDVYTKIGVIVYYEGNDYTLTPTPGWNSHKFTSSEYKIIHSSDWPIMRHIISGGEW